MTNRFGQPDPEWVDKLYSLVRSDEGMGGCEGAYAPIVKWLLDMLKEAAESEDSCDVTGSTYGTLNDEWFAKYKEGPKCL